MSDRRKFEEFLRANRQRFDPVFAGKRTSETGIMLTSYTTIWSQFSGGEKYCVTCSPGKPIIY